MIALYLRLSMADEDMEKDQKDESNSISNQRAFLQGFLETQPELLEEAEEFIDDGYTGTNFERPAFQRMIKKVKNGSITTVIVKDLSRFGRDYIGVGDYLEQIFPILGVRFIAVNNGYDSNKYTGNTAGIDMAVSNIINHYYSIDLSKKKKSSLRIKWKNGYSTGSAPPFGYLKDQVNRGRFVLDPAASRYVRRIYDLALKGYGTTQIANKLNEEQIPTPGVYNQRVEIEGKKKHFVVSDIQIWALVMGKRINIKLGSRKTRPASENELVIFEEMHDPIVTREEFEEAQQAVGRSRRCVDKPANVNNFPLKGKVRCGNCRRVLSSEWRNQIPYFFCRFSGIKSEQRSCPGETYEIAKINAIVFHILKNVFTELDQLRTGVEEDKLEEGQQKQEYKELEKRADNEIQALVAEKIQWYEAYSDGSISKEQYLSMRGRCGEKIDTLKKMSEK